MDARVSSSFDSSSAVLFPADSAAQTINRTADEATNVLIEYLLTIPCVCLNCIKEK
jgi:hypothetical protein